MVGTLNSVEPVKEMAAFALWSHEVYESRSRNQFEQPKIVKLFKMPIFGKFT